MVSITVTHTFVNPQADSGNTSITQPSNWNADHTFGGMSTGGILFANSTAKLQQSASNLFWDATNNRLGVQNGAPGAILTIGAGNTTIAPVQLTANTSLLTTPVAGSLEYDGTVFYNNFAASQRGVNTSEQFIGLTSAYTLGSNTTQQKIFNAPTNGTLTVLGATTYMFDCCLNISGMSATSGNFIFDVKGAGTATLTSVAWYASGLDATALATGAALGGSFSAVTPGTSNVVTAAVGTAVAVWIKGIIRVNAAGTIIPSLAQTTASAAIVGINSFMVLHPIGTNTVQSVGNWS